jgi:hypothetical protein
LYTSYPRTSNEERVLVVGAGARARRAHVVDGLERGAEGAEERPPLARRRLDGVLHGVQRVLGADGDVGKELVGALDLRLSKPLP